MKVNWDDWDDYPQYMGKNVRNYQPVLGLPDSSHWLSPLVALSNRAAFVKRKSTVSSPPMTGTGQPRVRRGAGVGYGMVNT